MISVIRASFAAVLAVIIVVSFVEDSFAGEGEDSSGTHSPWVIYIGDDAFPVPVKPIVISEGRIFLGLDTIRVLGGELHYDKETKTVKALLAGKSFVLSVRDETATLDGEGIPRGDLLAVKNKWYLAKERWEEWGYRPVWHPNFRAWQVIGRLTRYAYNEGASDFVFETTLPVEVIRGQDYEEKRITLTIIGAFTTRRVEETYGTDEIEALEIDTDPLSQAVIINITQGETTGFKVYAGKENKFHRLNFRNHFQLADYEKTSSEEIRLKVKFGKPTRIETMELKNPDRLVLDFPESIYTERTARIDVGIGHVERVRIGQVSEPPGPYIVRVVVDLSEHIGYRIIPSPHRDTYYIQFLGRVTGKYAIMLDAGHGGSDPGAQSPFSDTLEKDLNLDITQRVGDILTREGQSVLTTRDGDYYVTLIERADVTNRLLPMFFVSIHNNSFPTEEMQGVMTFHYEGSTEGARLASLIHRRLVDEGGAIDKGVRTANFYVLRETLVPAVLVECGFITNPEEEAKLRDPAYRDSIARAIAHGILDYCAIITEEES